MNPFLLQAILVISLYRPTFCSSSPKINIDTDDFKSLVLSNDIFVDKTLLIEEFNQMLPSCFVPLIIRPRGWGKSTNMDMLKRFYEIEVDEFGQPLSANETTNDKLFLGGELRTGSTSKKLKPLKISYISAPLQYLGKMPVISLKLENVTGKCYEEIEQNVRSRVMQAFQQHKYLLNDSWTSSLSEQFRAFDLPKYFSGDFNTTDLKRSLFILSASLYDYFKRRRVVILIDDYDTPMINAFLEFGHRQKEYDKVVDLLDSMYQLALKGNIFLHRALVNGVLRLSFDTIGHPIARLDNLEVCTFFYRHFTHYYGFTRNEVRDLLEQLASSTDPDQINTWYGGYRIDEEIFLNERLVMQCLSRNGSTGYYDSDIATNALVDRVFSDDEQQPKIQSLISGRSLNIDNFFHLMRFRWHLMDGLVVLLYYGFLNKTNSMVTTEVAIPNKEIQHIYERKTLQWVADKFGVNNSQFASFAELLITDQMDEFRETLPKYLSNASRVIRAGIEQANSVYNGMTIALQTALSYTHEKLGDPPESLFLIPKSGKNDVAIVFMYKMSKKLSQLASVAKDTIDEINNCDNCTDLKTFWHVRKVNKIAVAFCGIHAAVENRSEKVNDAES